MYFIDQDKNKRAFNSKKVITRKKYTANVYSIQDNKCLKVFNTPVNEKIQRLIQSLNLPHFFEAEEFLYNKMGELKAIIMPFYKEDDISPILKPTSFLLENIEGIKNDAAQLAKSGVEIWDLHPKNVIWTETGAIIIDTDDYKMGFSQSSASYVNAEVTTKLLTFILMAEAKKVLPELRNKKLYEYFYSEGIEYIHKILEDYAYPIDYIRKLTR